METQAHFTGGDGFYFMGLGQGSRGSPPSWVCLSSVIVNIPTKLKYGARMLLRSNDWITYPHTVGAMFVDDSDLYYWVESMQSVEDLYETTQEETNM